MKTVPSKELQKELFNLLNLGDYPIYEVVPAELGKMPLITIGSINRTPSYTKTNKERFRYNVIIHGWDRSKSSNTIKDIEEFIYQTVMTMDMIEYNVEFVELVMNNNLREDETADNVIFHAIQEFEITISRKGEDKA